MAKEIQIQVAKRKRQVKARKKKKTELRKTREREEDSIRLTEHLEYYHRKCLPTSYVFTTVGISGYRNGTITCWKAWRLPAITNTRKLVRDTFLSQNRNHSMELFPVCVAESIKHDKRKESQRELIFFSQIRGEVVQRPLPAQPSGE